MNDNRAFDVFTGADGFVHRGVHNLKTHPEPFNAVCNGVKTHEVRKNDRGFKVGDILHLHEWCSDTGEYSGRWTGVCVTYISTGGQYGLPDDLCVMSIGAVNR
jgi:hypothetical protein